MANKIDTIERDGKTIIVYDNGMERDAKTGYIVKRPDGVSFTPVTGRLAVKKRQEKAAAELRKRIRRVAEARLEPVKTSADAFGESGALLFDEIVLNPDAYPRDRLEAWEKLGKYAKVLPTDSKEQPDASAVLLASQAATVSVEAARIMLRVWADVKREQERQAIEGKVIE